MTGRLPLLALLAVVLLEGCGGEQSLLDEGDPYTARQIMRRFEEATGDALVSRGVLDLTRFGGGRSIGLSTKEALWEKYGEFGFVVEIEPPGSRPSLSVVATPEEGRDRNGIYWEHEFPERGRDLSPYWGAVKIRGNVKLQWFSNTKVADRRWQTLDNVLMSLGE